ncbi:polysaccharide deacetylase family protein [Asaia krungthepensis]|nr:polysaccharide deacetylase family protein [Asaia krungthepensis]
MQKIMPPFLIRFSSRALRAFGLLFLVLPIAEACASEYRQPALGGPDAPALHAVAMTFDDLPYVMAPGASPQANRAAALSANAAILDTLRRHAIPVTAFVNEDKVQALGAEGPRLVQRWNEGAFVLANHGFHHFDSNTLTPVQVEREITQGEATIGPLAHQAGRTLTFFRFPYNHVGDTEAKRLALSDIVHRHGYRLAATTIDVEDYLFNDAYECAFAHARSDAMGKIERAYLDYVRVEIPYYRALDTRVMGREIPSIMLLHSNRLNAVVLPAIIDIFRKDGTRFITLEEAQADPAYAIEPRMATVYGPMWGYRWARERHIAVNGALEPEAPAWIRGYCKTN